MFTKESWPFLAAMCTRWQGQPLTKISGFLCLHQDAKELFFPIMELVLSTLRLTALAQGILSALNFSWTALKISSALDALRPVVIHMLFRLVHIKQFYRHWIHFRDISVTGSVNSKTKWGIFAVFNYVSMAVGSHSLIANCSCFCCTAGIWLSNFAVWENSFEEWSKMPCCSNW